MSAQSPWTQTPGQRRQLVGGDDPGAARPPRVDALAAEELLVRVLGGPVRHVVHAGVTGDVILGLVSGDGAPGLADDHGQFSLGIDLIWFGVIVVLVAEMGVITPPVGVNVFVIKGIAPGIPIETIFKGIFPFLGALVICTAILIVFPQIATFLPRFITY